MKRVIPADNASSRAFAVAMFDFFADAESPNAGLDFEKPRPSAPIYLASGKEKQKFGVNKYPKMFSTGIAAEEERESRANITRLCNCVIKK